MLIIVHQVIGSIIILSLILILVLPVVRLGNLVRNRWSIHAFLGHTLVLIRIVLYRLACVLILIMGSCFLLVPRFLILNSLIIWKMGVIIFRCIINLSMSSYFKHFRKHNTFILRSLLLLLRVVIIFIFIFIIIIVWIFIIRWVIYILIVDFLVYHSCLLGLYSNMILLILIIAWKLIVNVRVSIVSMQVLIYIFRIHLSIGFRLILFIIDVFSALFKFIFHLIWLMSVLILLL